MAGAGRWRGRSRDTVGPYGNIQYMRASIQNIFSFFVFSCAANYTTQFLRRNEGCVPFAPNIGHLFLTILATRLCLYFYFNSRLKAAYVRWKYAYFLMYTRFFLIYKCGKRALISYESCSSFSARYSIKILCTYFSTWKKEVDCEKYTKVYNKRILYTVREKKASEKNHRELTEFLIWIIQAAFFSFFLIFYSM